MLDELSALERLTVVSDTAAAMVAGHAPVTDFLLLAARLSAERDPDVWGAALGPLGLLDRILSDADRPLLQAFVRAHHGPVLAQLGWDPAPGEAERIGTLRARLLSAAGTLGADPAIAAEARSPAAGLHRRPQHPGARPGHRGRHPSSPTPAARTSTGSCTSSSRPRPHPRTRSATSTPWPRPRGRTCWPGPWSCACPARSGPKMRPTSSAPSSVPEPGPAGLAVHRAALGRHPVPFPGQQPPPDAGGHVRASPTPSWPGRIHSFLDAHPLPQAKLVAQSLEKLDNNVALAERVGTELPTVLPLDPPDRHPDADRTSPA